jgi:hypothetical protein
MVVHSDFEDADHSHPVPIQSTIPFEGSGVIRRFKDQPVGLIEIQGQLAATIAGEFVTAPRQGAHIGERTCRVKIVQSLFQDLGSVLAVGSFHGFFTNAGLTVLLPMEKYNHVGELLRKILTDGVKSSRTFF